MSTSALPQPERVCVPSMFTKKRGVIRQHAESSVAKKMPFHSLNEKKEFTLLCALFLPNGEPIRNRTEIHLDSLP